MRHRYLQAVLRQDVGYFDTTATSGEAPRFLVLQRSPMQAAGCRRQAAAVAAERSAGTGLPASLLPTCVRLVPPPAAGRLLQGLTEDCQTIQQGIGDKV